MQRVRGRHLPADIPDEACQLASDGSAGLVLVKAPRAQSTKARTKPQLRFPSDLDNRLRQCLQPWRNALSETSWEATVPCRLDENPPDPGIAGLGQLPTMR